MITFPLAPWCLIVFSHLRTSVSLRRLYVAGNAQQNDVRNLWLICICRIEYLCLFFYTQEKKTSIPAEWAPNMLSFNWLFDSLRTVLFEINLLIL